MSKTPNSSPSTASFPQALPQQLSIAFDTIQLRALSRSERTKALSCLAAVLMQAAGLPAQERDDEPR